MRQTQLWQVPVLPVSKMKSGLEDTNCANTATSGQVTHKSKNTNSRQSTRRRIGCWRETQSQSWCQHQTWAFVFEDHAGQTAIVNCL